MDGCYSWTVSLCALYLWFLSSASIAAFGVYYVEFLEVFQGGELLTSWILACHLASFSVTALLAAECVAMVGFRWTGCFACGCACAGSTICFFASDIRAVYLGYGFFMGVAGSIFVVVAIMCIQAYFKKYISVAMGIAGLGSSLGALIVPALLRHLVDVYTPRGSLLILSAIFLQGLPFSLYIRPNRKLSSKRSRDDNAEVNKKMCQKCYRLLCSLIDLHILKDLRVALFAVAIYLVHAYTVTIYAYTIARGIAHGETKPEAAVAMTVFGACNALGRLMIGWLGDKVRRPLLFAIITISSGIISIVSSLFYTRFLHRLCSALIGFAVGGYVILIVPSVLDVVGSDNVTKITGLSYLLFGLAGIVTMPLTGFILEVTRSYDLLLLVMGCSITCGGAILWFNILYEYLHRRPGGRYHQQNPLSDSQREDTKGQLVN